MAALHELSIVEASAEIATGRVSPLELTDAFLDRITRFDGVLHSYATVTPDIARAQARAATEEIAAGRRRGPLHGIPANVKDTIATAGIKTTGASALYENWIPEHDAGVVTRLKAAGAVLLGKAICSELGFLGPVHAKNPWAPRYYAGASSSGSVSSLAARLAMFSVAGDSGGSIRDPAALCGVTGFKPTFGRVSRTHTIPLSYSFDTIGPIARSAADCALVFDAIAAHDPEDPVNVDRPVPRVFAQLERELRGLRVGVPRAFLEAGGMQADVTRAFEAALAVLGAEGAVVREIEIPHVRHAAAVNWTIMRCEGFNVHRRALAEQRKRFSPATHRAFAVGAALTADDYLRAQQARTLVQRAMGDAFAEVDIVALPTRPVTSARGKFESLPRPGDAPIASADVNYVSLFNVSAGPAISVPCGFDSHGLPIGLQLGGRAFDDATVLAAAHGYQRVTAWHRAAPKL